MWKNFVTPMLPKVINQIIYFFTIFRYFNLFVMLLYSSMSANALAAFGYILLLSLS